MKAVATGRASWEPRTTGLGPRETPGGGREGTRDRQSEHRSQAPEPALCRHGLHCITKPHTRIREGETEAQRGPTYHVLSGMRSWAVLGWCWGLKSPVGRGSGNETGREEDRPACEHPSSSAPMLTLEATPSPAPATPPHPTRSPLLRMRGQDAFLERGLRGGAARPSLAARSAGTGIKSGE